MSMLIPETVNNIRHWWLFLLRGVVALIVGFVTFRYPAESYLALSIFFGFIILFSGIMQTVYALSNRHRRGWGWQLLPAVIDLVLGILLITNVGITMTLMPFLLGLWVLFGGITLLSFAGVARGSRSTVWLIICGIILLILGGLIMYNPVLGAITIVGWAGIGFLAAGIFNIILASQLRRINRRLFGEDEEPG